MIKGFPQLKAHSGWMRALLDETYSQAVLRKGQIVGFNLFSGFVDKNQNTEHPAFFCKFCLTFTPK